LAKHENRHLTTEQLSAYIDKQLSEQERAICKLHLQTCEHCQSNLATLKQTVALLKALPEPTLPRSFVLPAGAAYLQEKPAQQQTPAMPTPPTNRRVWPSYLQRSLRAASIIAAVIGLVFLLSGVLPTLHTRGGTTVTTSSGGEANSRPAASPNGTSTNVHTATGVHTPAALARDTTPTTTAHTPTITTPGTHHEVAQAPPLFALNTDMGRQDIGWLLIVLGIVGVLLTRRKRLAT
jgi:predicted anti-sigma-YlaC factor YlaD